MLVIATIGPSTNEKLILRDIIDSGANMIRLNFSHGRLEEFEEKVNIARSIKSDIEIMQDLSGSKIRVSDKLPYIIKLYHGEEVFFCGEDSYKKRGHNFAFGSKKVIPLNISKNILNTNKIRSLSMKDNTMLFEVLNKTEDLIKVKVIKGGVVRAGKGCNIKGINRSKIPLSEKDRSDILWGINHNVDVVCQSFVESPSDIKKVKSYIKEVNMNFNPKIWAKVETPIGVKNIEYILKEVDGVVIGRGDLIPESNIEDTPIYESKVIESCVKNNKEVIVATHLLNSMKNGRKPELPEVEGIYNFVNSGVSGFLLAVETSIGKVPIKTVDFLTKIIKKYSKE